MYDKIKPKLGEEEARVLLNYIESSVEGRAAPQNDLHRLELHLRGETLTTKSDLLKRMVGIVFAFWVGNTGGVAVIFYFSARRWREAGMAPIVVRY
ncbi:MAG: hypothetical protein RMI91_04690 [Gemmatales bacterium]|nr:hypothetical protein [Gemmatales bacterium]MDW7993933.1 hypothetical protein [Gemmatales bacterium]